MTTKEDSELSDQEATRKEQSQWDKTQEDSEADQTKGLWANATNQEIDNALEVTPP